MGHPGRIVEIDAGSLGRLCLEVHSGTTPITPASRVTVAAVERLGGELSGLGIDWGTGVGTAAIAAARVGAVRRVLAIDIDTASLTVARRNADHNGVADRITFVHADGYTSLDGSPALDGAAGEVDFLIANPPGSHGDDGLGWRRRVLDGGRRFLRPGASAFLQVSAQYGRPRIEGLAAVGRLRYGGVVATSGWEPFDLDRPDLRALLDQYVTIEEAGGPAYRFGPGAQTAAEVAAEHARTGESPLTQWQVHRFDVAAAQPG